jgi:hypothetical protein
MGSARGSQLVKVSFRRATPQARPRLRGSESMPVLLTDFVLFSCVAPFITGIVIAVASLLSYRASSDCQGSDGGNRGEFSSAYRAQNPISVVNPFRGGVWIFRNQECRYLSIYDSQPSCRAGRDRQGVSNHDHWPTRQLPPGSVHLRNRRVCHQRGTLVYGKRTRPNSARRKQRNRPSRAHMKKWRSIGCYSPD